MMRPFRIFQRMRADVTLGVALLLAIPASSLAAAPPKLPRCEPAVVGMDAQRLEAIEAIVAQGIRNKNMPGAVVLVGRQGHVVYHKAFGNRQLEPSPVSMTTDTVFDMASLTKPVATATSVMRLVQQGQIALDDVVVKHLPRFGANGKETITIEQLMTHQSGLIADNALRDYQDGPKKAMRRIEELSLVAAPGTRFIYSDVGYIVLAAIVEEVSGMPVDEFARQHLFEPLGMEETGYLPAEPLRQRAAPTEKRKGDWMRGEVHDPRAYHMEGVAGHAGLFSTADDLAVYAQMLLGGGEYGGVRVLEPATVAEMIRGRDVPGGGRRALGWDVQTGYSSNRGDLLSESAFGHGGFTGTVMWIDPELELFYIFLSNRLHPEGKGVVNALAGRIGTVAAGAIVDPTAASTPPGPSAENSRDATDSPEPTASSAETGESAPTEVLTGIDVLQRSNYATLQGQRVGLITNHTGINLQGRRTVELLHEAAEVDLRVLFSPEHGFEGQLDIARIEDGEDSQTGLKIVSLYGQHRTPTPEHLADLDTLVFDIQDIGARFYTYISTMGNAMRAAAEQDLRFVVLDRPNPIGGVEIEGPLLDEGSQSFVGWHTLPVRHGMTVGELARMFNEELELNLDLEVIQIEGWQRTDYFDRTGLLWIHPSPNMRSMTAAVLYPGVGLLETTNLSVGRGTDRPFELLGAPWIDARELARELNDSEMPGVRFVPVRFTPESSKFAGQECGGVNVLVTDRSQLQPVRLGVKIAEVLRRLYGESWETRALNRLLSHEATRDALLEGRSAEEVHAPWEGDLERFRNRRQPFLLY